jgi:RimJ/RimL family protein N-acetyltransferase
VLEKYKVISRKASNRDIETIKIWMKNEDFARYLYSVPVNDDKALTDKVKSMLKESSADLSSKRYFMVFAEQLKKPIGLIMFHDIQWRNRNLALDFIIGDKEMKNKIWGTLLIVEAIRIIFEVFNMHKFYGTIYRFNSNSERLISAFDGKIEGVYKGFAPRDGKRHDATVYAMFKKDYPALLEKLGRY